MKCNKCNEIKGFLHFNKCYDKTKTYQYYYKTCIQCKTKERYKQNKIARLKDPEIKAKYMLSLKKARIKRLYKITLEEYEQKLVELQNKCEICNKEAKLVIDHSHTTSEVRGLLCNECNTGLGFYYDNPNFLKKAIEYLEKKRF